MKHAQPSAYTDSALLGCTSLDLVFSPSFFCLAVQQCSGLTLQRHHVLGPMALVRQMLVAVH